MKIYTKKGDAGDTMLFGGDMVAKHHIRIEAYGTVDELNSFIGLVCVNLINDVDSQTVLKEIQNRLFTVGSVLASSPNKKNVQAPDLLDEDVFFIEQEIDRIDAILPPLTNFILPGGTNLAAHCHVARCVCRRAERRANHLKETEPDTVPEIIIRYLNRLSDYLFVLSRKITFDANSEEVIWISRK